MATTLASAMASALTFSTRFAAMPESATGNSLFAGNDFSACLRR